MVFIDEMDFVVIDEFKMFFFEYLFELCLWLCNVVIVFLVVVCGLFVFVKKYFEFLICLVC